MCTIMCSHSNTLTMLYNLSVLVFCTLYEVRCFTKWTANLEHGEILYNVFSESAMSVIYIYIYVCKLFVLTARSGGGHCMLSYLYYLCIYTRPVMSTLVCYTLSMEYSQSMVNWNFALLTIYNLCTYCLSICNAL